MRILFLGFSKFIQSRVLGYLDDNAVFSEVAVASRSALPGGCDQFPCVSRLYTDYDEALDDYSPDIVYISLINSLHTQWIRKSLEHDCHVIVDKPACVSLDDSQALVALANQKGRCLAEALVYASHVQMEYLKEQFVQARIKPQSIVTTFSFPPFAEDNFRNREDLGGGAVWDLGPYAVSLGRIIFQAPVQAVSAVSTATHAQTGVITGFSLLSSYPEGRTLVGHFSFDTQYRNSALVLAPGMNIELSRIFTTPSDLSNTLKVQHMGVVDERRTPACNAPVAFLEEVVAAINAQAWKKYSTALLDDAYALDLLCKALEK